MSSDLLSWNNDTRSASFNNFDADAIFQMPLFSRDIMDCRVWNVSSDEKYSVKSSYSLRMRLIANCRTCLWIHSRQLECNLETAYSYMRPPLPMVIPPLLLAYPRCEDICILCDSEPEDCKHVFLICPIAKQCWGNLRLDHIIACNTGTSQSFADVFFKILKKMLDEDRRLFMMMFWSLWKCKNSKLCGNKTTCVPSLVTAVRDSLH